MSQTKAQLIDPTDGSIVNADINASAAIAKSKIETFVNTNADNRVITGSDTANTLNGESTLTFDNGKLDVTQTTSSSDSKVIIRNSNTPASGVLRLEFHHGTGTTEGTDRFRYGFIEGYRHGGSNDGGLIFGTKPSNAGNPTERVRIDPSGRILSNHSSARANVASIGDPHIQHEGLSSDDSAVSIIRNSNSNFGGSLILGKTRGTSVGSNTSVANGDQLGTVRFAAADGTDCNCEAAFIQARIDGTPGSNDTPGKLFFATTADGSSSGTTRMVLDSKGNCALGTTTISDDSEHNKLVISGRSSNAAGILIFQDTSNNEDGMIFADNGSLILGADRDNTTGSSFMAFRVDGSSEKMRINSSGQLLVNATSAVGNGTKIEARDDSSSEHGRILANGFIARDNFGSPTNLTNGMYSPSSNTLAFATNSSERMRIDSNGLVLNTLFLVGLSSTLSSNNAKLQVAHTDANADIIVHRAGNNANPPSLNFQKTRNTSIGNYGTIVQDDDELGSIRWGGADGSAIAFAARIVGAVDGTPGANDMPGRIQFHTSADGSEGLTERMRIGSDGNVGIGLTDANFRFHVQGDVNITKFNLNSTGDVTAIVMRHARGGLSGFNGKMISFQGNDNTEEGSINIHTTSVAYNTSSDYRLKENEVAISDGITKLKQLKPYRFNFKKDPDVKVDGFFAHEVASVVPIAVTGEKDAMEAETRYEEGDTIPEGKVIGDPKTYSTTKISPQQLDYSKLVPLLVAAVQEEIAKRESLETRVAALETA